MKIFLYIHTLRYMRVKQIVERLVRRFRKIRFSDIDKLPVRTFPFLWVNTKIGYSRMISEGEFVFLNVRGSVINICDWNDKNKDKLWIYNLHYFEDLISFDSAEKNEWHCRLIDKWVHENPLPFNNGWEPYPISLRVVNWIKWFLNGQVAKLCWTQSLIHQIYVLNQKLEYHLFGNHLFANGKALIYAGLYFEGKLATEWLTKGLEIIDLELQEQVLKDGANFELTPMYHNIMLVDVLDLINIAQYSGQPDVLQRLPIWRQYAAMMLGWMETMIHPDGEISFFNDATIGISPPPYKIRNYAKKLNITPIFMGEILKISDIEARYLIDSGYIRVESDDYVALLDCARIGPDYIPGHAHADSLSFELSLFGLRFIVNSGIDRYGLGEERLRQRGTIAHNTVTVDNQNSSEVWGGFRVARRAYPSVPSFNINDGLSVGCFHTGYRRLKGRVIHNRQWFFNKKSLRITDTLSGKWSIASVHYNFHPDMNLVLDGNVISISMPNGRNVNLSVKGGHPVIEKTSWHPEFGVKIDSNKLVVNLDSNKFTLNITWE